MERLTYFDEERGKYDLIVCRECKHHTAEDCLHCEHIENLIQMAGVNEDAEENGTLIRLPIKPGTPVWVLEKKIDHKTMFVRERFVNSYGFSTDGYINMQLMVPEGSYSYPVDDIFLKPDKIGKTVFLSEPEARKALEGMNNHEIN